MRKGFKYAFFFPLLLLATLACSSGEKLIPRKKFSRILAEMFILDCQLARQPQAKRVADTSLVYQAVFEKYGFDSDDYRHSQEVYIKDAKRYERMVRRSLEIVENEGKVLRAEKKKVDEYLLAKRDLRRFIPHNLYLFDTLSCMDDFYDFDPQRGLDTIYRGPAVIIPALDTLKKAEDAKDTLLPKVTVKEAIEKILL